MSLEYTVRPFEKRDVPPLLDLMKALARFEGYDDEFCVTEADLIKLGLGDSPIFGAFVAATETGLLGYAVHHTIPFTYDLRPTLILKELYVTEQARGLKIGQALFEELKREAIRQNAARLKWLVLPDNVAAKRFYQSLGGNPDTSWENWQVTFDS